MDLPRWCPTVYDRAGPIGAGGAPVQEVRGNVQRLSGPEELPARSAASLEHTAAAGRATPLVLGRLHALAELLIVRRGPYAEAFENLIVALIILSIASIGVAAIPGLPAWADRALRIEEIVVVA